jgi:glycosyltransferase involved in cell wall biosynthesis
MTDQQPKCVVGIDASNIRSGGGVTHLSELLAAAEPKAQGVDGVVVWSNAKTLAAIADRPWLIKVSPPELNGSLVGRIRWQYKQLSKSAEMYGCDVLFVPGGSYAGKFHPVVSMSQNLLPFEWKELLRFGWSVNVLKFFLLRFTQGHSFRQSDGVIFLTDYAAKAVLKVTGPLKAKTAIIPHGLSDRFVCTPRPQHPIEEYTAERPLRLLYVSMIDHYKHQWNLVEAVALLRRRYPWHLSLELVGPANPPALERLAASQGKFDPDGNWAHYRGAVPYSELHNIYSESDIGVFMSSCENMPNILLETMGAGLPVACSNIGPMPELLGSEGKFFFPEDASSVANALRRLIEAPELRAKLAKSNWKRARNFTWERTANQTFAFLASIVRDQAHQQ